MAEPTSAVGVHAPVVRDDVDAVFGRIALVDEQNLIAIGNIDRSVAVGNGRGAGEGGDVIGGHTQHAARTRARVAQVNGQT